MSRGGDEGVARVGRVAVLDPDQTRVRSDAVGAGEQAVGVPDAVVVAVAGEHGVDRGAVLGEVGVAQPGAAEHGQVVRRRHLSGGVVAVGRDDVGVAGAEGAGLGLHLGGGARPAAVHRGEHVHGVVAGVEEDPAPQVRDTVGVALGDADHAAALADALQLLLGDGVPDASGQPGQDGEGEEGLEGAGGRQRAVGVVGGEHVSGAGVGDQPRQRGDVLGNTGRAGAGPYLDALLVERRGRGDRGPRCTRGRAGQGGCLTRGGGQDTGHAERGAADGDAGGRRAGDGSPE